MPIYAKLRFTDSGGKSTYITHRLVETNVEDARADALAVASAYAALSDATLSRLSIEDVISESNHLPGDQNITVAEEAVIFGHLTHANQTRKLATLRVPSPKATMFEADKKTVKKADANGLVEVLASRILVSDGETLKVVNDGGTTTPPGYLRYRATNYR